MHCICFHTTISFFELQITSVEEGKNCPDVARWLLIELTFCFDVSFLMILLTKLMGLNFTEQKLAKVKFTFNIFSTTKESLGNRIDTKGRNASFN